MAGKTVLDVGCGTAILSMFAARAGAAAVVGVDCSDMITDARTIVAANGFADRITLVRGKVEDLTLPVEKVRHAHACVCVYVVVFALGTAAPIPMRLRARMQAGGHYRVGVDGLLSAVREHAGHGALRAR